VGRPDANPDEILGFWRLSLVKILTNFRFLGEGLLKILTKPAPAEENFRKKLLADPNGAPKMSLIPIS
jgi:hypothetical protein